MRDDTRYAAVERQLLAELAEGRYPVGSRFPTEMDLCDRFAVSRHTVREALRRLVAKGLLERHQGAGSTVKALCQPAGFVLAMDSTEDLYQYAVDTRLEVEQWDEVAAAGLAGLLGCPAEARWLRITGRRVARDGGAPVCCTVIYLRAALAHLRGRIGIEATPIHVMIEQGGTPIRAVEQHLQAVVLTQPMAARLDATADSPGLQITRRYIGPEGAPLEVTVSTHPGDRLHYRMVLRRA